MRPGEEGRAMPRPSFMRDALALYMDGATLWANDLWRMASAAGPSWVPDDPAWQGVPAHLDHWARRVANGAGKMQLRSVDWISANWCLSVESVDGSLAACMVRLHAEKFLESSNEMPRCSVLAVDDEPFILNALRRLLRRTQFDLRTAGSADEAQAMLRVEPADIVLSDQRMPGMTGVQLLAYVRDLLPDTVRIILSGYSDAQSITDAVNEGAVYKFIAKPWDDAQLLLTLNEAAEVHRTRVHTRQLQVALASANADLSVVNQRLNQLLSERDQLISLGNYALRLSQDINDALPFPICGIDSGGQLVTANDAAARYLGPLAADGALAGLVEGRSTGFERGIDFAGRTWVMCIGQLAGGAGKVVALIPEAGHVL